MKNIATIPNNEILDLNPKTSNTSNYDYIKDVLKRQVLLDYNKGIRTARLSVFPSDYYTLNGTKVIDYQNGDIFQIGQIINPLDKNGNSYLQDENKNDVYFRIVDRKVRYEGQVIIDLVLLELKNHTY